MAEQQCDANWVLEAHNRLHDGDIDGAHEALHRALGMNDNAGACRRQSPAVRAFDYAFATAARRNGVSAAWVMLEPVSGVLRLPGQPVEVRVITGGNADVCRAVDDMIRQGMSSQL